MNDDLISRSALRKDIEHLYSVYAENKDWFYTDVLDHIDNAPTDERKPFASFSFDKDELNRIVEERVIEPIKNGELVVKTEERPQGKWEALNYHTCYCTNCNFDFDIMKCDFMTKMNFCPNCGADMRGEQDE